MGVPTPLPPAQYVSASWKCDTFDKVLWEIKREETASRNETGK